MLKDLSKKYCPEVVITRNAKKASDILGIIFNHIGICVKGGKSKKEVTFVAKTLIGAFLNERTKNGINEFIFNMEDKEVDELMLEIQKVAMS